MSLSVRAIARVDKRRHTGDARNEQPQYHCPRFQKARKRVKIERNELTIYDELRLSCEDRCGVLVEGVWDTWQSDTDFWKCNHRRPSMSAKSQKIKKAEWWFIIICRDSSLGD